MFSRRHWDALFRSPILAISDPQTEVDWQTSGQRAGFYIGTFEHDLVPEILALINKVCDELGIGREKVVLYGASAGGTAALLVGSRRREQTGVIAVCPYLRPDKYREQVVEIAARAAGGDVAAWEKMAEATPWRANPLTALRDGLNEGNDTRVVVAQNLKDKTTINRHFPGIWRRFDIPPEGGLSANGRVMTMMYDADAAGHGHEPTELSLPLMRAAYEFFGNPIEEPPKKEKKFSKAKLAARAALAARQQGEDEEDDEDEDGESPEE
jgi:pimeloyl-ACP methyl ester carboxylesterase